MGKLSMLEMGVSNLDEAIRCLLHASAHAEEAGLEGEAAEIGAIIVQVRGYRGILFEAIGGVVMNDGKE